MNSPSLRDAIEGTRQSLKNATTSFAPAVPLPPLQLAARATASWALVHGFAMLLLDGRLRHTLASLPGEADANALLEAVLDVSASTIEAFRRLHLAGDERVGQASWPMLEPAPWPQMKPTSSPSGSSFSLIELISVAWLPRAGRCGRPSR